MTQTNFKFKGVFDETVSHETPDGILYITVKKMKYLLTIEVETPIELDEKAYSAIKRLDEISHTYSHDYNPNAQRLEVLLNLSYDGTLTNERVSQLIDLCMAEMRMMLMILHANKGE